MRQVHGFLIFAHVEKVRLGTFRITNYEVSSIIFLKDVLPNMEVIEINVLV